jgi:hypothetical protein
MPRKAKPKPPKPPNKPMGRPPKWPPPLCPATQGYHHLPSFFWSKLDDPKFRQEFTQFLMDRL